jgi:hypothetical protein
MTPQQSDVQLIGETVTVSYVADPSIGRGQFRLENAQTAPITASVVSAWLELGDNQRPLTGISVFDLDHDQALDPDHFEVGAESTLRFLMGFPVVAYEPRFGEATAVGLRLNVDGTELTARSLIEFIRRLPLNR